MLDHENICKLQPAIFFEICWGPWDHEYRNLMLFFWVFGTRRNQFSHLQMDNMSKRQRSTSPPTMMVTVPLFLCHTTKLPTSDSAGKSYELNLRTQYAHHTTIDSSWSIISYNYPVTVSSFLSWRRTFNVYWQIGSNKKKCKQKL